MNLVLGFALLFCRIALPRTDQPDIAGNARDLLQARSEHHRTLAFRQRTVFSMN
jgi:hypothetical protein